MMPPGNPTAAIFLDGDLVYATGHLVRLGEDTGVVTRCLADRPDIVLWEDGFEDRADTILGLKGTETLPYDPARAQQVLTTYLNLQEPGARWHPYKPRRAVGAAYRALFSRMRREPNEAAAWEVWRAVTPALWTAEVEAAASAERVDPGDGWSWTPGSFRLRKADWAGQGEWLVYPDCESHADLPAAAQARTPVYWCWEGPRGVGRSLTLEGAVQALWSVEREDRVDRLLARV